LGGYFGSCLSSYEANYAMGKASFDMDDDHDLPDMYYYDIPSEDTELSFEEYVRIAYIDYTYSRMDEKFGDWELKYDIKKATRITDEGDPDIEEANAYFHEIVYNYYEFASDLPVGSDEEETLEEMALETLEQLTEEPEQLLEEPYQYLRDCFNNLTEKNLHSKKTSAIYSSAN